MTADSFPYTCSPVVGYVRSAISGDPILDELAEQIQQYPGHYRLRLAKVVRDERISAVTAWRPVFNKLVRDLNQSRPAGAIIPALRQLGQPRSAVLRSLAWLRATSAWVAFVDGQDVPPDWKGVTDMDYDFAAKKPDADLETDGDGSGGGTGGGDDD